MIELSVLIATLICAFILIYPEYKDALFDLKEAGE